MSQKLFNQIVGVLVLLKAIIVGYFLLTGTQVVCLFGPVAGWVMGMVIFICLGISYVAFTIKKKQQKLFNQLAGILSGMDAATGVYYFGFGLHIILGNWIFPDWLLLILMALDVYMFYTALRLAKKIK